MSAALKVTVAKTAGFCFGVERAVKTVEKALQEGKHLATLGPLIHNPTVINDLEAKGARIISSVSELNRSILETAVIRSHGVGIDVYTELNSNSHEFIDATCPYVAKIQKIVREQTTQDALVIILGDINHPEVIGILGHASKTNGMAVVCSNPETLKSFFDDNTNFLIKKVAIVAQTTYNIGIWDKCVEMASRIAAAAPQMRLEIFPTICHATLRRQEEAAELAAESDMMIVLGGRQSSNTVKLLDICSKHCKRCLLVETVSELHTHEARFNKLPKGASVGITAGASTPADIIKEVQTYMNEFDKNLDEDFNFEEALEQTFKKIYTGNRVKGYITAVNNNEAIVDVGTKHTGYVPLSELTDDPSLKPADVVNVGEEIDFIVIKINDQEGIVTLSKKRVDSMIGFYSVMKAKDDGSVLEGNVISIVKGGLLVNCNGARVFIPASQATQRREDKLEDLMRKTVKFKVLEVNEQRGRAVGSIRAVTKEAREEAEKKFWDSVKVGDVFKGEVKSITSYGAFVDLGGIDGMVHISELSWNRIKHPSEIVSVGDQLEVYVKDLEPTKNRISLGYRKEQDNPWERFKNDYNVGDVANVTIVSITPFGAFAQIIPGIDGLVHISQIAVERVNNVKDMLSVGQTVDAKITEIDIEKRRISLSIRALSEDAASGDKADGEVEAETDGETEAE